MFKSLFIFTLLSSSLYAEELEIVKKEGSVLPALKVLPAGSELTGVRIPRYNANYTPASMLKAQRLKIISKQQIQGTSVDLTLYDDQGAIQAATHLNAINYDQSTELITSKENFVFSATQFQTTSQGLIFDWENSRGFFLGNNHTIVYLKESTSMKDKNNKSKSKSKSTPSKAISALAAATMATTPNALNAMTPQDVAEMDRLSQPSTEKIQELEIQTNAELEAAHTASAVADKNKAALILAIQESDPKLLDLNSDQVAEKNKPADEAVPAAPFEIPAELKPVKGKDHFSINSAGNFFFDAKQGIMVFNKDVKVIHPEYHFSCAGEVKLLLAKKKLDKKLTPKQVEELNPNERLGDVEKIIATDNVAIVGKDKDGKPVAARAGSLVYDHTSGVIILRGLNSRITLPDQQLKIVQKNGYIKIDKNWNVSGFGTEISLNLEKLKKKNN